MVFTMAVAGIILQNENNNISHFQFILAVLEAILLWVICLLNINRGNYQCKNSRISSTLILLSIYYDIYYSVFIIIYWPNVQIQQLYTMSIIMLVAGSLHYILIYYQLFFVPKEIK